jgi:hypothetical protein
LFGYLDTLTVETVLTEPVWSLPHHNRPVSLIEYGDGEFQTWLAGTLKDLPTLPLLTR